MSVPLGRRARAEAVSGEADGHLRVQAGGERQPPPRERSPVQSLSFPDADFRVLTWLRPSSQVHYWGVCVASSAFLSRDTVQGSARVGGWPGHAALVGEAGPRSQEQLLLAFNSISLAVKTNDDDGETVTPHAHWARLRARQKAFHLYYFSPQTTYKVDRLISLYFIDAPIRAKEPVQVPAARKWQRQALNPGSLAPDSSSYPPWG